MSETPTKEPIQIELSKCFSLDGETFNYGDLADLLIDMHNDGRLELGAKFWEADCRVIAPADFKRVDSLLDDLDNDLCEEVGEIADGDFSIASKEAKAELQALLVGWIDRHVNVGRYWKIVGPARECVVEPAHMEGFSQ